MSINVKDNIDKFVKDNDLDLLKIEPIGNYKYHLHLKCNDCNKDFIKPYPAKNKNKICNSCMREKRKKATLKKNYIKFKEYVADNSNAKLLDTEFKGWNVPHSFECECGNVFDTRPTDFKCNDKRTCNECTKKRMSEKMRHSIEYVRDFIKNNTTSILISNEYINNETELTLKCECGESYKTKFILINSGHNKKCPKCINEQRAEHFRFTYEDVKKWITEELPCTLLSTEYSNNHTPLELRCECDEKYQCTLMDLRAGKSHKCPKCMIEQRANICRHSIDYIRSEIEKLTDSVLLSTEYKNFNSKLKLQCSCGISYYSNFATLRKKEALKCKKCNHTSSKSENITEEYLIKHNIEYIREKTFDSCRYLALLPFDFYLPEHNILCELDGIHHFQPVCFNGTSQENADVAFESRIVKDKIKDDYALNNSIKLIRIPYYNFNKIEEILIDNDIV